ncbi:hypothetical protein ColKHC_13678 [Colletotrichum higginsianum]|nr:hypothetical protein ColKHC_13678 [Colletotrichum higginsianum]
MAVGRESIMVERQTSCAIFAGLFRQTRALYTAFLASCPESNGRATALVRGGNGSLTGILPPHDMTSDQLTVLGSRLAMRVGQDESEPLARF